MSSLRPLPTMIGPTENALRALLSRTLSTTKIKTYRSWVVMNAVGNAGGSAAAGAWRSAVADALKIVRHDVDEVVVLLRRAGLISDDRLTEAGEAELASARSAVAATTAQLVEGIADEDQDAARRALDQIRRRADELLAE